MNYMKVRWANECETDPVELYMEVDESGWEVRKIEILADGTIGCAGPGICIGSTRLGEVPLPPIDEIAADVQFAPMAINREEFEGVWHKAMSPAVSQS